LAAFFFMLTLLVYVKYAVGVDGRGREKFEVRNPKPETDPKKTKSNKFEFHGSSAFFYALTLLFFALGLMSKPMAVTLPFFLLLLDSWPLQRFQLPITSGSRLFLEKVPFLALTAGACVLTFIAQNRGFAVVSTAGLPLSTRVSHALVSYLHYLGAMLLPRH